MSSRIYVVGDTLLDRDVIGTSQRDCPDSTGPVVDVSQVVEGPGGAGLAAMLAAHFGAEVTLCTGMALDWSAQRIDEILRGCGVALIALPLTGATPVKTRIRVAGQTVSRIDTGDGHTDVDDDSLAVDAFLDADAVLVSDYGRSLAATSCVRAALRRCVEAKIPVVWDPHPLGARPVPGTTLMTPNQAEARRLGFDDRLRRGESPMAWGCHAIAVTAGHEGVMLYRDGQESMQVSVPADSTSLDATVDVCGAGDALSAAATIGLARGDPTVEAVRNAVSRATAILTSGCRLISSRSLPTSKLDRHLFGRAPQTLVRPRARHGIVVATGGCFDVLHPGHLSLLNRARALGDSLIVCLNSDNSVMRAKGPGRPVVPATARAAVLAALACVDEVIVFDEDTPERAIATIRPDIWVKGGDYSTNDLAEVSTVRANGGQVVVLPIVPGYSTTAVVESALRRSHLSGREKETSCLNRPVLERS